MEYLTEQLAMMFFTWILVGFFTGLKLLFVDDALSVERRERFSNDHQMKRLLESKALFMFITTSLGFMTLAIYIIAWYDAKRERKMK